MLRLHGMAGRADTATVCAALYEKGIEFEHFQPSIDEGGARRELGLARPDPQGGPFAQEKERGWPAVHMIRWQR